MLQHKCKAKFDIPITQKPFVEANRLAKSFMFEGTIRYCVRGRVPAYRVGGKSFQKFVQVCLDLGAEFKRLKAADIIPHRTTVSRNIKVLADKLRGIQFPEFRQAILNKTCASAIDLWTERIGKNHFMGMILQYIVQNPETKIKELKNKVLFLTLFEGQSTGVNLKEHLQTCCEERGFPMELMAKLKYVCDGGADLCLCLNLCQNTR